MTIDRSDPVALRRLAVAIAVLLAGSACTTGDAPTSRPPTTRSTASTVGSTIPPDPPPSMAIGEDGWSVQALVTVGESIPMTGEVMSGVRPYTPPGRLDGLGAFPLNSQTIRVFANHELAPGLGYAYRVQEGQIVLDGARISYFDIDRTSRQVVDAGIAYDRVYDFSGATVTDRSFLPNEASGFNRFCSGALVEAGHHGDGRGFVDRIYFAGEEVGGDSDRVGGALWALDPATGSLWHVPDAGRGAWENVALIDTGDPTTVAILLSDDTAPFDADGDGEREAAPLYLYVGVKDPGGDFLARNGLRGGDLHVWVAEDGARTPADFNGGGARPGRWMAIASGREEGPAGEDETIGLDEFGFPTQRTLWVRAGAAGAFGFSRPEDIAVDPSDGSRAVLASTGVADYAGGADTFGTLYVIATDVADRTAELEIIYDGDADPERRLRSPDNLDWADDGAIYVQEDRAVVSARDGEQLFGPGAVNRTEAGIVRIAPDGSGLERVATINRATLLDPTAADPPFDRLAGMMGEWESSGILDVSMLFGEQPGTWFLFDVQAHGITNQSAESRDGPGPNPGSRINDADLVEGGQLLWLIADD